MATYTDANGVKLITTGDEAGTWGSSTNVNLQILDRAANGFESIALSSTSYTLALSAQPSSAENGHYKAIKFTGTPGGTCTVTLAQNDKARMYMLLNSTNQALIITQGSGGNVTLEVGKGAIVLADGAGSGAAVTDFTAAVQNVTDLSSPFNVGATSVTTSGAELNLLDGSGAGTIANSKAVIYGSSGEVNATTLQIAGTSITATAAELNYVDGVTSAIQTQIDAKQPLGTVIVTVANPGSGNRYYIDGSLQQTVELKPSVTYRFDQSDASNSSHPLRFSTNDNNSPSAPFTTGVTTAGTPGSAGAYTQVKLEQDAPAVLYYYCSNHSGMGGKAVVRMSDLTASRALTSDAGGDIAVSAVTTTELGYLDGVTSAIQTQIDSKQATITGAATTIDDANLTASRAVISNSSGKVAVSAVTDTELGYLDGVTSAIQTQIDSKQATITGAATTIDDADLTASRAVISNASGKVAVSGVTTTELDILDGLTASTAELNIMDGVTATTAELNIMDGVTATTAELNYVDGVTSAIQTQINSKIDGSALNASNLSSGTVPDARLSGANAVFNGLVVSSSGSPSTTSDLIYSAGDVTAAVALNTNKIENIGSNDLHLDSSQDVILDTAGGGDVEFRSGGSVASGKINANNAGQLLFKAGTNGASSQLLLQSTGVNVHQGLRVGDTQAATDNDIYAVADVEAGENVIAGGVLKLTAGSSSDWTFEVLGSNELFIKFGSSIAVQIPTGSADLAYLGVQASSTWTTGTNTLESVISPAKLKSTIDNQLNVSGSAPIYGVRAWVNFVGNGSSSANATLNGSGNIATVYKTGTGNFTATFTTALPDANYAITFAAGVSTSASANDGTCIDVYAQSATAFSFTVTDPSGNNYANPHSVMITVVR